jgi:hypothetical protein
LTEERERYGLHGIAGDTQLKDHILTRFSTALKVVDVSKGEKKKSL